MNIIQKIKSNFQSGFIKTATDEDILLEAEARRGNGSTSALSDRIQKDAKDIHAQNIKDWKLAVATASNPEDSDWSLLAELYENLLLDNHLRSVIDSRILYVQRSPFVMIDDKEEEEPEITKLIQKPWMEDLIRMVLISRFQGRTLIEIYSTNKTGELTEVTEIPQPYFNAQKGIIVKEPGNETGWEYKEGALANHYLQIGRNDDLGMLEKLALVVLSKKMGTGAWLDYLDTFGVPPLFITTDREDENRLNQLYKAALKFKKNNFMIGRGQEKFEIPTIAGHGTAPFSELIEFVNSEVSKAILGGSGITDEKAYVGSSEIQFKLAKDRYESDKIMFQHIFNHHIKPMLIKLSPVYAPLEKYQFKWDETESLDMEGIIDTIQKLGNIYDIDPEYVTKVTGIPIEGFKQNVGFQGYNPSVGGQNGKKI